MINFFMRIRKQLADDNKPLKYLRYAIGEIVLVVIGILIALQINNWNEERHQKAKEEKLLIELDRDLASNMTILKDKIKHEKKFIKENTSTVEHIKSKKPFNDSIGLFLNHSTHIEKIQFTSSAYESLKSVGVDIISSDSIRADITNLFSTELPQRTIWIRDAGMNHANLTHPYFVKFFEVDDFILRPTDYEGLLKSQEFINIMSRRKSLKMVIVTNLETLLTYIESTRIKIQNELETF